MLLLLLLITWFLAWNAQMKQLALFVIVLLFYLQFHLKIVSLIVIWTQIVKFFEIIVFLNSKIFLKKDPLVYVSNNICIKCSIISNFY